MKKTNPIVRQPLYQQVARAIENAIAAGEWKLDEAIPSEIELAEEFGVSRQAVYDNIKRTEKILEAYEMKLHMYSDYIVRSQIFDDIMEKYPDDSYLQEQIAVLSSIDNRD